MALSPRIEIRQNQSLAMTPQLQQAIKLLQMTNLQLSEFVAAEVEKNPLLELAAPNPAPGAPVRPAATGLGGMDGAFATIAAEFSLGEHLQAQIRSVRAPSSVIAAALFIADELDDDGYLRAPLAEVAERHGLRETDCLKGLAIVQSCDPAGVGARSLRECLALQLKEKNRFDPAMEALVDRLPLAATGQMAALREACGVDAEDLADMLAELRALDPKPGARFARQVTQVVAPDVFVTRSPLGSWSVELNAETLPRVLVDNRYAAELGGHGAEAKAFVSECAASANWLVRSLQQRARTILKVTSEIVLQQEGFFTAGPRALRPLTQRALAERLSLHESTISRVAAGKYLLCERGLFELKYFFSASIQALSGGEAFSAAAVQERIRLLIQEEGGRRTLSDDKIVAALNTEGIDVARRTVAKYREGMGIPSSVERRRLKANQAGL